MSRHTGPIVEAPSKTNMDIMVFEADKPRHLDGEYPVLATSLHNY